MFKEGQGLPNPHDLIPEALSLLNLSGVKGGKIGRVSKVIPDCPSKAMSFRFILLSSYSSMLSIYSIFFSSQAQAASEGGSGQQQLLAITD